MKTVYKAFDEVLGMEVAWNKVMLNDVLRSPEELPRLYTEIHLLKTLNHESIIRCYSSWKDTDRKTFNFITEMLTSGTLREYRLKFKDVNIRAIKNWARQILQGLAYLHSLNPPVIHRDLKCDNIFVNGHLGQVKIGDFGLAAVLEGSLYAHRLVGTPEFTAPEVYMERYNVLADVYSFGMCVLEMLTSEFPYEECLNYPQIFKKVSSGKKPSAFYRIQDMAARRFVAKCLKDVSTRPQACELLLHPFLSYDDDDTTPAHGIGDSPFLFSNCIKSKYVIITGTVNTEDNTLSLRVRFCDKDGYVEIVDFPFDIAKDTSMDVATEMIKEIKIISDWEPHVIADMIEEELSCLVPEWNAMNSPQGLQHHSFYFDDDNNDNHTSHESFDGFCDLYEEPLSRDPNPFNLQNTHQGHLLPNSGKSPANGEKWLPAESSYSTGGNYDIEYLLQRDESKNERFSGSSSQTNTTTKGKEKLLHGTSDTEYPLQRDELKNEGFYGSSSQTNATNKGKEKHYGTSNIEYPLQGDEPKNEGFSVSSSQTKTTTKGKEKYRDP